MAGKRPVSIRLRKSSPLTIAAAIAAIVLSTVALVALRGAANRVDAENEALRQQAAALVAENQGLSERIESLGSVESAILIAMEELGLVEPGTTILEPRE